MFFEKGDLVFEQPLITYFKEGENGFSVGNIVIQNHGNSIVENVSFSISFNGKNIDCSFEQSSYHIRVLSPIKPKSKVESLDNNIYTLPFLNGTEYIRFQFKLQGYIRAEDVKIELRGKGYVGHQITIDKGDDIRHFYNVIISFLSIIIILLLYGLLKKFTSQTKSKDEDMEFEEEPKKDILN